MNLPYKVYFGSLFFIHFVYGMVLLGIFSSVPQYIYVWNMLVQVCLCLFLLYRYHPFRKSHKFEEYDARLIFGSALLLLTNIISLPLIFSYFFKTIDITNNKIKGSIFVS